MKKMSTLLAIVLLCMYGTPLFATAIPASHPAVRPGHTNTMDLLTHLTPKSYERLTGRKMKFRERIALKILKWKYRRNRRDGATERQLKLGRLSLILSIVGLGLLFIPVGLLGLLGVGLSIAAFLLGLKSLKGNSNTPGLIGLILSSLVIFFIILAVIIIARIEIL